MGWSFNSNGSCLSCKCNGGGGPPTVSRCGCVSLPSAFTLTMELVNMDQSPWNDPGPFTWYNTPTDTELIDGPERQRRLTAWFMGSFTLTFHATAPAELASGGWGTAAGWYSDIFTRYYYFKVNPDGGYTDYDAISFFYLDCTTGIGTPAATTFTARLISRTSIGNGLWPATGGEPKGTDTSRNSAVASWRIVQGFPVKTCDPCDNPVVTKSGSFAVSVPDLGFRDDYLKVTLGCSGGGTYDVPGGTDDEDMVMLHDGPGEMLA